MNTAATYPSQRRWKIIFASVSWCCYLSGCMRIQPWFSTLLKEYFREYSQVAKAFTEQQLYLVRTPPDSHWSYYKSDRPLHKHHVQSPKYLSGNSQKNVLISQIFSKYLNNSKNPRNISYFCFKNEPILNLLGQNFPQRELKSMPGQRLSTLSLVLWR